jgi:peptidyl-prolyl cis-trans isomerase C
MHGGRRGLWPIAALAAAVVIHGCGGERGEQSGKLQDTGTEILGDPSAVVAVADGEKITLAEVNLVAGYWASIRSPQLQGVRSRKEAQQRALDNIIDQHVLSREAERRGMTVPDSAVAAMLANWESHFSGPEDRDQKLAANRTTLDDVRRSFLRDLLVRALVDGTIRDTIVVDTAAARAYYQANPQYFDTTQVHARHILVLVPADAQPDTVAAARARAEALLRRVRAGEDFATLASKYSGDKSSAAHGGDLGFTPRGRFIKPFEDAVFALRPGEVSDVVATPFGFHIIQVLERREGHLAYDQALAERIRAVIAEGKVQPAVAALAGRLRAAAKIEVRI